MPYLTEFPNEIYYLTYPGPNMHLQKLRRSSGIDLNMTEKASNIFIDNLCTILKVKAFAITFDLPCLSLSVYLCLETETCHNFDINQHK